MQRVLVKDGVVAILRHLLMKTCKYSSKRVRSRYAFMLFKALTFETKSAYQTETRMQQSTQVDFIETHDKNTMVDFAGNSVRLTTINEVSMEEPSDDWFNTFWHRKRASL